MIIKSSFFLMFYVCFFISNRFFFTMSQNGFKKLKTVLTTSDSQLPVG